MSSIDNIITVNISQQSASAQAPGFGVVLIASVFASWGTGSNSDLIRYYTSLASVGLDFASNSAEYLAAQAAFSQNPKPTKVAIGKIPTLVAGVTQLAFSADLIASNVVTPTINGVALAPITYATSHAATMTAIATAIAAATGVASAAVDGSNPRQINITGASGVALTASETVTGGASQPTVTTTVATPAVTFSTGLAAIRNVDAGWYGLVITDRTDNCILDVAAWAETQLVAFVPVTAAAGALTTSTTDILTQLKNKAFGNTIPVYHAISTEYPGTAWEAEMLSYDPGSANWNLKALAGITPNTLTDTQQTNLKNKNGNFYNSVSGVKMMDGGGKCASGQYADVKVGLDWFKVNLQVDVFNVLVSLPKVPFTDAGIAIIESALRARVAKGVAAGIIDGSRPITYAIPKVADISQQDRAARNLPNMAFTCYLAGAIDTVTFNLVFLT
jgi:hypothetical protein